jgi:hypothetical protein
MSDIKPIFLTLNPTINIPNEVVPFIFSGTNVTVSTGTFVIYNRTDLGLRDMISDQYSGFGNSGPFLKTAFEDADGVGYEQEQHYKCSGDLVRTNLLSTRMIKKTLTDGIVITKLEKKFKKI